METQPHISKGIVQNGCTSYSLKGYCSEKKKKLTIPNELKVAI
jgi:hypothetical protein